MKNVVISLGGSLIIPEQIDFKFLHSFKKIARKFYKTHRFIVVCGGGSIARRYIESLKEENKSLHEQSLAGIRATRMNALFLMQFFGKEANNTLPRDMKEVKSNLLKNNIVICGALRYSPDETSDGTAAKLANYLKTPFINLTNVPGLFTSDPKKHKNAKLIPEISWKNFEKLANKTKFTPGQHFVLDQEAAKMIRKDSIPTYILGRDLRNLEKLLKGRVFTGTTVSG